jgi:tetratricopeptide (TPR) repeat protein
VTPGPLIPARELLGDILMAHQMPAEALAAYEATLRREPNRARTLVGAARAARAARRMDEAKRYYRAMIDLRDPASKRPELREARTFVS